jgi:putative DNA primase/helicase
MATNNGCDDKVELSVFVDEWIEKYHLKTRQDSGTIYYYKDGVYIPGNIFVEQLAQKYIPECDNNSVKEVKGIIMRKTYTDPKEFVGDLSIINVKNGLLDLKTGKISPHNPDTIYTVQLPVIFNEDAKCPKNEEFLQQVLKPEDIDLIYEIAGWLLWRQYHIHRAIMLYGHGRNGKGVLLRLFEAFLGIINCSHVSLQKLVGDRFAPVDLVGKAANIFGDLPQKDLSETDNFKCLTGGDTIRVEAKFGKAFDFRNEAKLIFSCNNLPKTNDNSTGFYVRWIIILFRIQFGTPERPLNPDLDDELQTPEELSGFLNKALEGLSRLRSNNWKFSYTLTEDDITKMYKRLSDPVYAFVEDCCKEDFSSRISKKELHEAYIKYARANKLIPMNIKKFGKCLLEQDCMAIEECWITQDEDQCKGWQGVKLAGKLEPKRKEIQETDVMAEA